MSVVVNLGIAVLMLGVAYAIFSEGLFGSALMLGNVVFAGLVAFNFYEPLAKLIVDNLKEVAGWADMVCLMVLFLVTVAILRILTDIIAPKQLRFPTVVDLLGRLVFSLLTGALTVGFLLCAFDTAPVHKRVFGAVEADTKPPFGFGLDHKWLGLVRLSSSRAFARYGADGDHVFDPNEQWLVEHQEARPYGEAPGATPTAQ